MEVGGESSKFWSLKKEGLINNQSKKVEEENLRSFSSSISNRKCGTTVKRFLATSDVTMSVLMA